jgi:hypothetical protein
MTVVKVIVVGLLHTSKVLELEQLSVASEANDVVISSSTRIQASLFTRTL